MSIQIRVNACGMDRVADSDHASHMTTSFMTEPLYTRTLRMVGNPFCGHTRSRNAEQILSVYADKATLRAKSTGTRGDAITLNKVMEGRASCVFQGISRENGSTASVVMLVVDKLDNTAVLTMAASESQTAKGVTMTQWDVLQA